ncbi:MAG: hypothetical protein QM791_02125 [Ferruginibacter sp.]
MKQPKRKGDFFQVAAEVAKISAGIIEDPLQKEIAEMKKAAKFFGRQGGLKGGPARAKALSPKKRTAIAKKAAAARWKKK